MYGSQSVKDELTHIHLEDHSDCSQTTKEYLARNLPKLEKLLAQLENIFWEG